MGAGSKEISKISPVASPRMHAAAGAVAGALSLGLTYPLLTMISRLQVGTQSTASLRELYAGFPIAVAANTLSQYLYYYFYSLLRAWAHRHGPPSAAKDLLVGFFAGVMTISLVNPLWVVTAQQQTSSKAGESNGLGTAAQRVLQSGGIRGFWKGLGPSIVLCANPSVQYMVFERVRSAYASHRMARKQGPLNSLHLFWLGAFAKTVATIITYPLQTIKTRMQSAQYAHAPSVASVVADLLRKEGPSALFRGLGSKIFQSVLTAALLVAFQDRVLRLFIQLLSNSSK